jgi:hypothetical protein
MGMKTYTWVVASTSQKLPRAIPRKSRRDTSQATDLDIRTRSLGSQRKSINALAVCTAANSAASREGKLPFTWPVLDSVLGLPDFTIEY